VGPDPDGMQLRGIPALGPMNGVNRRVTLFLRTGLLRRGHSPARFSIGSTDLPDGDGVRFWLSISGPVNVFPVRHAGTLLTRLEIMRAGSRWAPYLAVARLLRALG
jgi:hypothetical protein